MNQAHVKIRKLGKAPKHKLAMLRNMICSLVKYERIETTKGKARELNNLLVKVFDMLYLRKGTESKNKSVLQGIFTCPGAYQKLLTNLKPKLAKYQGKEFLVYVNRIRYASCAKMCIVELAQNPKKRKEDKRFLYFTRYYNNSFFSWELSMRKSKLKELLDYHMQLTTILRVAIDSFEENKIYTKAELMTLLQNSSDNLPQEIIDPSLISYMKDRILFTNEESLPKTKVAFLQLYNKDFSDLNYDINDTKLALEQMREMQKDPIKLHDYDKSKYQQFYKEELEEFKEKFKITSNLMTESKQGIVDIIQKLKIRQDYENSLLKKMDEQITNLPEELLHVGNMRKKSKAVRDMEKSYNRTYISGDESGFSGLDDLENPPKELVLLRKYYQNKWRYNTKPRDALNKSI